MSPGVSILVGILAVFGLLALLQWMLSRRVRALVGKPAPALPPPFDERARGDVLFWFHSPTCGPCRAMEPYIEQLAARGAAESVDVMVHPEVAQAFGVMATPTTIHVRSGRVLDVRTGVLGPAVLAAILAT